MEFAVIDLQTQTLRGIAEFDQPIPDKDRVSLEFNLFLAEEFGFGAAFEEADPSAFVYQYGPQTILGVQKANESPLDLCAFIEV